MGQIDEEGESSYVCPVCTAAGEHGLERDASIDPPKAAA
jgi:hypothetical protein